MVLKQLVVFADSDVSLRLETVADQAAISSNTVSPAPLRIRRSTVISASVLIHTKDFPCMIDIRLAVAVLLFADRGGVVQVIGQLLHQFCSIGHEV